MAQTYIEKLNPKWYPDTGCLTESPLLLPRQEIGRIRELSRQKTSRSTGIQRFDYQYTADKKLTTVRLTGVNGLLEAYYMNGVAAAFYLRDDPNKGCLEQLIEHLRKTFSPPVTVRCRDITPTVRFFVNALKKAAGHQAHFISVQTTDRLANGRIIPPDPPKTVQYTGPKNELPALAKIASGVRTGHVTISCFTLGNEPSALTAWFRTDDTVYRMPVLVREDD